MVKQRTFEELQPFGHVYKFLKGNLRSIAFRLSDGSMCLVNPIAGTAERAWSDLESYGDIAFIVEPNHYHNKGLKEASVRFPQARLCSSQEAIPRLKKITGLELSNFEKLLPLLPKGISIEHPEGLKTGEIWLRIWQSGTKALVVADAFCGVKLANGHESAGEPQLLKTFPTYGVKDVKEYQSWARNSINTYRPNMLVPFHGGICQGAQLFKHLDGIVSSIN